MTGSTEALLCTKPSDCKDYSIYRGSGYRTIDGSLNLKPYSTISCNMIVTNDDNAL